MTVGGMIIITGTVKLLGQYTGLDLTHHLQNKYYWGGIFLFCLAGSIAAHFWHIFYPRFVKRIDDADTIRRSHGNCYYYVDEGSGLEEGPVTIPEIRQLIGNGTITPRTLVRKARSSKDDVRPAKQFRELTEIGRQFGEATQS